MIAHDSNGLACEVYQCGVNVVRDLYWNVYQLIEQTPTRQTYNALNNGPDRIIVERCDCEGEHSICPGADIHNAGESDEQVCRCDTCQRYSDDSDAALAYVAALNRIVGHQYFVNVYIVPRQLIGLLNETPRSALIQQRTLTDPEIRAELARFWTRDLALSDDTQPAPPVSDTDAGALLNEP